MLSAPSLALLGPVASSFRIVADSAESGLLLSGDASDGSDFLLLSGDASDGDDILLISET